MTHSHNDEICFLVYASRAGSTYLASLLNCFDDIGVCLESNFIYFLLDGRSIYQTTSEIDEALDYFYADERSKDWNLDRSQLTNWLNEKLPLRPPELLREILKANFHRTKPTANLFVYKGCSNHYMNRLIAMFPESKVLFIFRDGRAVYASQKQSLAPYTNRVHSTNPVATARNWNRWFDVIDHISDKGTNVVRVKYEELITDVEQEVSRVYQLLTGRSLDKQSLSLDTGNYARQIPSSQARIHGNVEQCPITARINAWQKEIKTPEIYAFERTANTRLVELGYELTKTPYGIRLTDRLLTLKWRAQHHLNKRWYSLKAIWHRVTQRLGF